MKLEDLIHTFYTRRSIIGKSIAGLINGTSWRFDNGGIRYTGREPEFVYPSFDFY